MIKPVAKTVQMFRSLPASKWINGNLHLTREAAETYLSHYDGGGAVEEVTVDFGDYLYPIYYSCEIGGMVYYANQAGDVRYLGTSGNLCELPNDLMRPTAKLAAKCVATGKAQKGKYESIKALGQPFAAGIN